MRKSSSINATFMPCHVKMSKCALMPNVKMSKCALMQNVKMYINATLINQLIKHLLIY